MSYQQLIVVGRVGRDSELSYTPTGVAVAKFSLASNKTTGKGEGKRQTTTWFKVTLWRERAENLSQYIKQGDLLMVVGEIDASAYLNKDGQPTASLDLTANSVTFLTSRETRDSRQSNDDDDSVGDIPF